MNEFVEKFAMIMFVTILVAFVGLAVFYMKRRIQNAETSIKDQAKVIQSILEMVGNLATRIEENKSNMELSIDTTSQSRYKIEKESKKIVVSDDDDDADAVSWMDDVKYGSVLDNEGYTGGSKIEFDIKSDVEQVIYESKEKYASKMMDTIDKENEKEELRSEDSKEKKIVNVEVISGLNTKKLDDKSVVYVDEIDNEESECVQSDYIKDKEIIKEIKSAGQYENYKMTELRGMMDDRGLNSKGKLKKDIIDMLVNYDKQQVNVE